MPWTPYSKGKYFALLTSDKGDFFKNLLRKKGDRCKWVLKPYPKFISIKKEPIVYYLIWGWFAHLENNLHALCRNFEPIANAHTFFFKFCFMHDLNCIIFRYWEVHSFWGLILTIPEQLFILVFTIYPAEFFKKLINSMWIKDSVFKSYKLCHLELCLSKLKYMIGWSLTLHISMKTDVINLFL